MRGSHRWPVNSPHKGPGPCITNVFATCRKNFSQWHHSFQRKLRSHWLKFLRHVAITLVIQDPVTRKMLPFDDVVMSLLILCDGTHRSSVDSIQHEPVIRSLRFSLLWTSTKCWTVKLPVSWNSMTLTGRQCNSTNDQADASTLQACKYHFFNTHLPNIPCVLSFNWTSLVHQFHRHQALYAATLLETTSGLGMFVCRVHCIKEADFNINSVWVRAVDISRYNVA